MAETDDLIAELRQLRAQQQQPMSWGEAALTGVTNIPSSGLQFAKDTIYPFLHPVQTARTFRDLAVGISSKAGIGSSPEDEAKVEAVAKFFADRYGSMDALKNTLATDPVGLASDIAAVLTAGGALAAKAPGTIGKVGSVAAKAGRAIDPLSLAVKGASKAGGFAAPALLGMTTGTGDDAVRYAYRAGETGNVPFIEHMRGTGDISEPVSVARRGLSALVKDQRADYVAGMGSVNASTATLNLRPLANAIRDARAKVSPHGVVKSDDAARILEKTEAKVAEFLNSPQPMTPGLADDLKQAIGEIRLKTEYGSLERKITDDIYHAVRDMIVKQAPEYGETMKRYASAADQIDELTRTLSLGERANPDTTLRKLTSTMRNNVNTNFGQRAKLIDQLAVKQPDLPYMIAGQTMNSLAPRGISRLGLPPLAAGAMVNPAQWPTLMLGAAATSPRLVGEAAYAAGRAAPAVRSAVNAAEKVARPAFQAGRMAGVANQPRPIEEMSMQDIIRELQALRASGAK